MRTFLKDILAKIDAEIACLEQTKALMNASGAVVAKRKPGRRAKVATLVTLKVQKTPNRGKMSADARERIRQVQIRRWAALKGVFKANVNATVAPLLNGNRGPRGQHNWILAFGSGMICANFVRTK